jgi:uroporphyrinogen III methyltransferase / synthase
MKVFAPQWGQATILRGLRSDDMPWGVNLSLRWMQTSTRFGGSQIPFGLWDRFLQNRRVSRTPKGMVYLVGAGPGDAGLLTLRAAELIGRADVVYYDALVGAGVLAKIPPGTQRVYVGKRARDHAVPQEALNRLLVEQAQAGKTVVRLKGGDPYVFGRGGEEAQELAEAGVPFEVVPGISSVVAAPAYAGIPLTHRDHCSAFQVITGHEDPEKGESAVDWSAVARVAGTKVILMGVERIRRIAAGLMEGGMAGTMPVALIRWGTTARQQVLVSTLAKVADDVERAGFQAPAVTIVGEVVRLRSQLDWWSRRPLHGTRIAITRTREQASELSSRLEVLGAEILEVPTIRIEPPEPIQPLLEAVVGIGEYDWLVFTSPNGVASFFDTFVKAYPDMRSLGNVRIAAVGPATAAKVKEWHIGVDVVPERYLAADVTKAIAAHETVENLRFLLLRAEVANPDLPKALEEMGGIVDDVPCYRTVPETREGGAADALVEDGADWVTFTSSSTVENFHRRFDLPALLKRFPGMKTASIGPETTKALHALGLEPTVQAKVHTLDGLVEAILKKRASGK